MGAASEERLNTVFGLWTYHQGSEARFPPGPRGRRFWISFFGIDLLTRFKYSGKRSVLTKSCQRLVGKWRDGSSIFMRQKNASFITRICQIVHVPHTFLTHTKSLCRVLFSQPLHEYIAGMESVPSDTMRYYMDYHGASDWQRQYLYVSVYVSM